MIIPYVVFHIKNLTAKRKNNTLKKKIKSKQTLELFPKWRMSTSLSKRTSILDLVFSLSVSQWSVVSLRFRLNKPWSARIVCMGRYFPNNNDQILLPVHLGFWPENPNTGGEVSTRAFSARLPVVCRQIHSKQPFGMFRGENAMNYAFSTFLLEAVIIIFFIKITCFLLRPLRQPRIVCEIIVRH